MVTSAAPDPVPPVPVPVGCVVLLLPQAAATTRPAVTVSAPTRRLKLVARIVIVFFLRGDARWSPAGEWGKPGANRPSCRLNDLRASTGPGGDGARNPVTVPGAHGRESEPPRFC